MTPQSWFVLAVAVFYGACTAGTAATGLVDGIHGSTVQLVSCIILLIATACVCGVLVDRFRQKKPAKATNQLMVTAFTVIDVLAVLVSGFALSMLILPVCMFVFLALLPSQQEWLGKEKQS
ncbi:MAG: hypothetical protein ACI38U_00765 [Corynebacterium sp.]|jgi:hypothetical protein|uniref:hypothetical protein n=1 Tax=Corynebacterium sp. TaxID=1720 RepID=UPI003F0A3D07